MARCVNQGNAFSPDAQISGCTAVLQSGRLTGANRANAYLNRGGAYSTRRTTTAPSPTPARPSSSTRASPTPTTTGAARTSTRGLRPRHRRLQRGHQAQSEPCHRLHQPGRRVPRQEATTTAPSPTPARPSGSIRASPTPTTTGATRTTTRATTTAPLATTTRPSGSIRASPPPTSTGAARTSARRTTTAPSQTPARPSGSIRASPAPTPTGAARTSTRRTTTAPSPTTARPSGSIRASPAPTSTGARVPHKKDYDRAIADYSEAIRINPSNAGAYNDRAWAYFKAGKAAQGLPDAERSLQLRPIDANALDTRGHIFEALGRREEAIADFRRAQAADPHHQSSREALKRLGVTPDEFRRIHAFVVNRGEPAAVRGNLAQLLGWSTGGDVTSQRIAIDERDSNGKVIRRYAVDVAPGRERVVLICQLIEGDTTVCVLFNDSGSIMRVFEIFPDRNYNVQAVRHTGYHGIGYQSWRIATSHINKTP